MKSKPPFALSVVSALLAASLMAANPLHAAVDSQTGTAGTAGTNGTAGNPGTPGTDGTPGGNASANATTVNTDATNSATASGGSGGSGGAGGTGTPSGADGGDGGDGANGGNADATADTTVNTGNGSSAATTNGGAGGSGGAGGLASGGGTPGTGGNAGSGGNAVVSSITSNSGSGTANVTATANGGTGGNGGNAGGNGGNGGVASFGIVDGSSNGGTVSVLGTINGGRGGSATGTGNAGDGAAATAVNALTGSTSGTLTFNQNVNGGDSGAVQDGTNGTAGSAFSSLTKDATLDASPPSALTVNTDAFAGNGGTRNSASGTAADGAVGTANSTAINDGGSARAATDARGGNGGVGQNGANGGDGGDSFSNATAETFGDGNRVDADGFAGFASGRGGTVSTGSGSTGGTGGDATSSSTATANGNSIADATDNAAGGTGGTVSGGTGSGGSGGTGISTAVASNAGSSSVSASASASGGSGGTGRGVGESGGGGGAGLVIGTSGTSSGGANVAVTGNATGGAGGSGLAGADGGNGGNGTVNNQLSGSTSGLLTLTQTSQGGAGGSSDGGGNAGDGGFGDALLNANNTGGGNLTMNVNARGGNGGAASNGSNAGSGGAATFGAGPGTVTGVSNSGADVIVNADARGGSGGSASGTGNAGSGASVAITNAVGGSTGGDLTLRQEVTGGNSGTVDSGVNGTAGSALSSLTKDTSGDADKPASLFVDVDAFGGSGGTRDDAGGAAADGADGTATAVAINDGGNARTLTDARGGNGGAGTNGASGGNGGDAFSTSNATTSGDGNSIDVDGNAGIASGIGGSVANGTGSDGGTGGNATGSSMGTALGDSIVNVNDDAFAGSGGSVNSGTGSGGNGGNGSSSATGSNVGGSSVTVAADGRGGSGGTGRGAGESGGDGGDGTVVAASGMSTTGNVSVSGQSFGGTGGAGFSGATGGSGGDATITNALTGSTSGSLTLTQTSTGGNGGSADGGGAAGDAGSGTVSLVGNNTGGGTLNASATANGGTGGAGANGSNAGQGGTAVLAGISGISATGGTVNVTGTANGGDGGGVTGTGNAGAGASISVTDQVSGSSNGGALNLTQNVTGGNSGSVQTGANGTAGSAFSSLTKDATLDANGPSSLFVDVDAWGGTGGQRDATMGAAANGADGTANASASNDDGSVRAQTDARGGNGGLGRNGADGGDGGDSVSTAAATSFGDGNRVDVDGFAGLASGSGGTIITGDGSLAGSGGNATSSSVGTANGNSIVDARDSATGGSGGGVNSGTGTGGAGGNAQSSSTGSNTGSSSITVIAGASGGSGGTGRGVGESGGAAGNAVVINTSGTSTGAASVAISATANGGVGGAGLDGADGGLGGNGDIDNQLSGATSGLLTLTENANGGDGGSSTGGGNAGDGGVGNATLIANNTGGGGLTMNVNVTGGNGGAGSTDSNAGNGGSATFGAGSGAVSGVSNNGATVTVNANATGGNGGSANGTGDAGSGGSLAVTNAVTGNTTGTLNLRQNITGGNAGLVDSGANGTAGSAFSSLSRDVTADTDKPAVLDVRTQAFGGSGAQRDDTSGTASAGAMGTSITNAVNDGGTATAVSDARGGSGGAGVNGASGGAGGDAVSMSSVTTSGDGNTISVNGNAGLSGGIGGALTNATGGTAGNGGNATSTSMGMALGNSTVNVDDNAFAATGGSVNSGTGSGGNGGNGNSTATGSNNGASAVTVTADGRGGLGGLGRGTGESGGRGGDGTVVSASGSSVSGNVLVSGLAFGGGGGGGFQGADAGDGGNASVANALSGSTAGTLTLTQTSSGGTGGLSDGGGTGGNGGVGTASLAGNNTGGGNLNATADANGGNGGSGSNGSDAGDGGTAVLAGVSGTSATGGTLNITGSADGGNGGSATDTGNAGNGGSVSVTDQVTGSTSGTLTLTQNVTGGNSGAVDTGLNGSAGSAFNSLTKDTRGDAEKASSLFVDIDSFGGNGGERDDSTGQAAAGAMGTGNAVAINDAGSARVQADVRGGTGGVGRNGADSGDGGGAMSTVTGETFTDGATVNVDNFSGSFGGSGNGGAVLNGVGSVGGRGGDAVGSSIGTAHGDSLVTVNDTADGGDGGDISSGTGSGGRGGDATSSTMASNSTAATTVTGIFSTSVARGGIGGVARGAGEVAGTGGDASASAQGMGGAGASANATATGGAAGSALDGAGVGLGGNAFANATASGTAGSATATANAGNSDGNLVNDLTTTAVATVGSTVNSQASAQFSGAGFSVADVAGQQAASLGYAAPANAVSLPLVEGNAVHANFDVSGINGPRTTNDSGQLDSDVFGVGVLAGSYAQDGTGTLRTSTATANFDVDTSLLQTGSQDLLVGFMNPVLTGNAFNDPDFAVRLRINVEGGASEFDQTFTNETDLLNFFSGNTLSLGNTLGLLDAGDLDIDFTLNVTSDDPGSGFAVDFIHGNSTQTARAVPFVPNTDIDVGDRHVGDMPLVGVQVQNVAVAGSDNAQASFTGTTGDATTNSGTINALAAGASDNTSLQVGVDTSTSGNKTGTATIQLSTDGSATGNAEVFGSTDVTVTSTVYNFADPTVNNAPVALANVREGEVSQQALSISNNAPSDGFSENLNASAGTTTGDANASGSFTGLVAQQTDTTSVIVGIDTTTAGSKTGTVDVDFVSDGTGINSLGQTSLGSQTVNVSGDVFRLAEAGAHSPEPVNLGDAHVGDSVQQALSITNTAAADGFSESLNASIGGDTGDISTSGSFNLLGAQQTDNSSLVVTLDTSSVGNKTGSATISLQSDGTGTSNIVPNIDLADQTVNATGTVYRLASASAHTPEPVNFGNVHVGDTVNQALSITNTAAADGFSENLNASFNGTSGAATASGNFSGLGAQQTDNSSLMVGLNTATAGAVSGSATIDLVSDGAGINTLGQTGIGSQTVNVSGNVFRLAEATVDNPLAFAFGNVHVGDSVMQAVSISNTAADDGFSERLNAAFGSSSDARIQNNGGSFTLLGAQQTDNSSLVVSVDTSSSGVVNGIQTLNFVSDGSGTSELGQTALADQNLAVSAVIQANVFDFANPVINNAQPIDFGNVREGAMVSAQALSITNDVAGMADSLDASVGGTSGGVTTNNGSFTLLAPGATDNTSITVAIDTATAGQKDGNATIDFVSNGTPNGLGLTNLPSQDVAVTGNVFRLAEAGAHSPEPVNLGDAHVGDSVQQALSITNTAAADGFSESLNASIGGDTGDISTSGSFNLLGAQQTDNSSLVVTLDTSSVGNKTGSATISLQSDGTGTSNIVPNIDLADQTVNATGTVYRLASASAHTPEPVNFGNVHVGDTVNQALSITNTAAADGFSENLNASFNGTSGAATASGNFSGLGAQQTDNSSLMVGLNTATAGAVSGSATIDLVSDGAGINTLGQTGIGSQTVNVSGNVFRLAEATVDNPLAFAFGNVHVGDSVMQAVSISNTAADDGFSERLNAAFGSSSDARIQNNGGSFTLLGAQQTDNSSLVVSVDTSSSGVVNGTQTLNFVSDGSGTSELGQTALADQNLAVSAVIQANVFDFANPVINNAQPIDFGNVREGAMVSAQALSITNDVAGMADSLDASVGGTSGGVTTNNGSFTLLAPGATDNTSITVAIDTATAGQKDGNATIDLVSNGTPNGLGLTALPSQDVMVTGNVFRLAEAEVTPDPVVIHARVGDTAQQALTIANSAATDGFSEGLGVSSATAGGDASLSGTVSGIIAAGGSDSGLIVNLDTSTAGAKTGNVDLSYTSDGTGTSGLAAIANGGDTIGVSGNVYQQAVASVIPTSIDFGIVHVGDTVSQSIAVSNIAPVVALNDVLTGTLGSVDGPFTGAGGLGGGVAAGQTDSSSLVVGLDTGTAGVFTDTAQLALQSHNDDLVDLDLGISNISLMAQINEYANPVFELVSGAGSLSGGAFSYQLDLGNIVQGNSALSTLVVRNDVSSPADLLDGDFVLAGGVFDLTGFDAFVDLMAGQATSDLLVALDTSALGLGLFSGQITLGATGHNASGYSQDFDGIILNLRANVIAQNQGGVPTPGTWLLMLFGSGILLFRRVPR